MKPQRIISSILLGCIVAISAFALLCTMPMLVNHSHCSGPMIAISEGAMSSVGCVGLHYSTYLQTSLAIFEKQVWGLFLVLIFSTFISAFWLLRSSVVAQLLELGVTMSERYKRYWYFSLPLHRIKELQWLIVLERETVALVV
jgi:hypothetical protein